MEATRAMNRTKLPIKDIIIEARQRLDLGDIQDLADSIKRYGLIQPIIVNQANRLLAGERRLRAHQLLGLTEIDVCYKETLSDDYLHECEIEENVRRKSMSWQERTLAIETIHDLKKRRAALDGDKWGQRETAELIGLSSPCVVNYSLEIAKLLRSELDPLTDKPKPDARFWSCDTFNDAWRLRLRDEEDILLAELARRGAQSGSLEGATLTISSSQAGLSAIDAMLMPSGESSEPISQREQAASKASALKRYLSNPLNPPDKFEEYYAEKQKLDAYKLEIPLSNRLFNVDCLELMAANPCRFDHIITDPPYGIDIDYIDQHVGMANIDTIKTEHEVEPNKELLCRFFPAAFATLKDNGFCVTWCDQMLWQYMYDTAIAAGFKVQRWPITWVKQHRCLNQMAQYNFTKTTEIAMVCRKANTTLTLPASECHILAAHDDYKEELGHPFVKPFAVWEFILDHVSIPGQLVLEPFAGRGSGVISILRKQRHVIACELQKEHYNALLENVKQHYLRINPQFTFV